MDIIKPFRKFTWHNLNTQPKTNFHFFLGQRKHFFLVIPDFNSVKIAFSEALNSSMLTHAKFRNCGNVHSYSSILGWYIILITHDQPQQLLLE